MGIELRAVVAWMVTKEKGVIRRNSRLEDISMGPMLKLCAATWAGNPSAGDRQSPARAPWLWVYTITKLQAVKDTVSERQVKTMDVSLWPLTLAFPYTCISHTRIIKFLEMQGATSYGLIILYSGYRANGRYCRIGSREKPPSCRAHLAVWPCVRKAADTGGCLCGG